MIKANVKGSKLVDCARDAKGEIVGEIPKLMITIRHANGTVEKIEKPDKPNQYIINGLLFGMGISTNNYRKFNGGKMRRTK